MKKLAFALITSLCAQAEESAHTYISQAIQHFQQKNLEESINCFKKAYALEPNNIQTIKNLGSLLIIQSNPEEALSYYSQFFKNNGSISQLLMGMEKAFGAEGNLEMREHVLNLLHYIFPDDGEFRQELKRTYIRKNDWKNAGRVFNLMTHWWYNADITGKTILIYYHDHGVGDIINYVRYARRLKNAGARVIVEVPEFLVPLIKQCKYVDVVIPQNSPRPPADIIYPSSPILMLGDKLDDLHADVPYLVPNQELAMRWKKKISQDSNFKIGLCWHSTLLNSSFFKHPKKSERTINLATLAPLGTITGVTFYSLQKFVGTNEISQLPHNFVIKEFKNMDEETGRFMDTIAIMQQLDLIITVDTSIAHLAGAMGIPVWIMLPHVADFRWLENRSDTPWYPTATLFRQQSPGDWEGVVDQILRALNILLESKNNVTSVTHTSPKQFAVDTILSGMYS